MKPDISDADARHRAALEMLTEQVKAFYDQRKPFKVYHGSTNSTRVLQFDKDAMVDVSNFNQIISIDPARKTALVEANVPMDTLVDATLKHQLIPPVVMEFPGITVGGGLQGGAGESSSFKWGTFNRTLNWYDMVLADGKTLRVSPKNHSDLYWGAAGSYGSLGVVTAAEVQLIPAKTYVNVTYFPVKSFDEATRLLRKLTARNYDFLDGILYASDVGVIIAGKLGNQPVGQVQTFSKRRDPWFYLHAEKQARAAERQREAVPVKDYLFRYDRGAFWMGKYAFERFKTPFNRLTRWLFDPLLHTRRMYDALQASGVSQECIIQDLAIPAEHTVEFLKLVDREFGMYPLWLCPLLPEDKSPLLSSSLQGQPVINVGVWGLYRTSWEKVVAANHRLDRAVRQCGGKKWLYAQSFYSEAAFWKIYDKHHYDALRKKYRAETLPDVYQKTATKTHTAVSAKRGLLYVLLRRNGIRIK